MSHRHTFKVYMYSTKELNFRCKCGQKVERPTTKVEENKLQAEWKVDFKRIDELHHIWHIWLKLIDKEQRKANPDLFRLAHEFVVKFPTCSLIGVDDHMHMGARLLIVPHEEPSGYMGETFVYLRQNYDKEEQPQFFLYPHATKQLEETIKTINERITRKREKRIKVIDSIKYD